MALAPPPEKAPSWTDDHVLVTPEAEERVQAWEIWHHLGGYWDEGDTYPTQEYEFEQELNRFWTSLHGPDEQLRRDLLEALARTTPKWHSVRHGHAPGALAVLACCALNRVACSAVNVSYRNRMRRWLPA